MWILISCSMIFTQCQIVPGLTELQCKAVIRLPIKDRQLSCVSERGEILGPAHVNQ